MLTAVTGINWGDEGKGRVIDLLAGHADVVARYPPASCTRMLSVCWVRAW